MSLKFPTSLLMPPVFWDVPNNLSYYENCGLAIAYFSKLLEHAKTKGVKVSTYNCRWNNFVVSPMSWTLIHGHLKELGIKFDPSHSIYDGGLSIEPHSQYWQGELGDKGIDYTIDFFEKLLL